MSDQYLSSEGVLVLPDQTGNQAPAGLNTICLFSKDGKLNLMNDTGVQADLGLSASGLSLSGTPISTPNDRAIPFWNALIDELQTDPHAIIDNEGAINAVFRPNDGVSIPGTAQIYTDPALGLVIQGMSGTSSDIFFRDRSGLPIMTILEVLGVTEVRIAGNFEVLDNSFFGGPVEIQETTTILANLLIGTTTDTGEKLQIAGDTKTEGLILGLTETAVDGVFGANESIVGANTTVSAITITLATLAIFPGKMLRVQDQGGAAATNNITINTQGTEKINGADSIVINTNFGAFDLYSDDVGWFTRPLVAGAAGVEMTTPTTVNGIVYWDTTTGKLKTHPATILDPFTSGGSSAKLVAGLRVGFSNGGAMTGEIVWLDDDGVAISGRTGTVNDINIRNGSNESVMRVPTGTKDAVFEGSVNAELRPRQGPTLSSNQIMLSASDGMSIAGSGGTVNAINILTNTLGSVMRVPVGTTTAIFGGKVIHNDFTSSGAGNVSTKTKRLSSTTSDVQGGNINIGHGVTGSKIISLDALVDFGNNGRMPPNYTISAGLQYGVWADTTIVRVALHATNSISLLNKRVTVMVTYEA